MNSLAGEWVKKLWFAPYKLKLKGKAGVRYGTLLKMEFTDGKTGHADLHPYPEKGEAGLKVHLEKLKGKEFTQLCLRAVEAAREEAQACAKEINLLSSLKIPLSHYLILDIENFKNMDLVLSQGFTVFKVKLNHPLNRQSEKLLELMQTTGSRLRWRLDFHVNLNERQWEKWKGEYLSRIPQQCLDFIEAPFDYKERLWLRNNQYPLALDVWSGENTLPVSTVIWKSSRKSLKELFNKKRAGQFQRVVFTHSLAHPLDQLASAYFSARFYKVYPCLEEAGGLIQKDVYEKHIFTLPDEGPFFPRLSGPGWGLTCLLDRLPWKKGF